MSNNHFDLPTIQCRECGEEFIFIDFDTDGLCAECEEAMRRKVKQQKEDSNDIHKSY